MRRVNDCFAKAGNNLVDPKPTMTGPLFLRSQFAYKTMAGMALAGQVVEAFVMMRSCLEYAGYALLIFDDPALEDVFLRRHFDADSMKAQKQKFQVREITAAISKFDKKHAEIFKQFYDTAIDFGGHPNPNAVLSTLQMKSSGKGLSILAVALSADDEQLLLAMKCTTQVGLTALFVFQHIFEDKFKTLGISAEMASLCQENL